MAHHQSAKKRIRQIEKRRLQNRYYAVTTRNAIKKLRSMENKEEALSFYPKVISMIDKLVKRGQFHRNKSANLKSKLIKHINKIGVTA
ncbi:MAG TPA: 30S ribosomal protein S20 [Bacteroidetes bacterium]|nr:30S ribosomal protein S20 [Bacteroidota bacterium]